MLSSKDPKLLRPDVAANCLAFLSLCHAEGLNVVICGTVRDNEYQEWCFKEGHAGTPVPSFHGVKAGLAFDVCQKGPNGTFIWPEDNGYWGRVGRIGKRVGFSWGGDWKSFPDRPHFQWDTGCRYTSAMIRGGKYPPTMPLYEEGLDMTIDEARQKLTTVEGTGVAHEKWADDAISALVGAGIINGDGLGNFGWNQCLTREGMAVILYNLLNKLGLSDKLDKGALT
jgi:peptidoglycan L-alanyl-D-glutamate endopeptidase CwlK